MRHVLLESFVWEEANRVPFLIREFSYDRDPSVPSPAVYVKLRCDVVKYIYCIKIVL